MELEFIRHNVPSSWQREDPCPGWPSTVVNGGFVQSEDFRGDWWNDFETGLYGTCIEVQLDHVEVARLALNARDADSLQHYANKSPLIDPIDINKIEVSMSRQRRGIATAILNALAVKFSDRTLTAMAKKESESFWDSLGWILSLQYEHGEQAFAFYFRPAAAGEA